MSVAEYLEEANGLNRTLESDTLLNFSMVIQIAHASCNSENIQKIKLKNQKRKNSIDLPNSQQEMPETLMTRLRRLSKWKLAPTDPIFRKSHSA